MEVIVFPNNIRAVREARGIAMLELAKMVNMSLSSVSKIELGRRRLNNLQLEEFAKVLQADASQLVIEPGGGATHRAALGDWAEEQLSVMRNAVEQGASATAEVAVTLRKKRKATLANVAEGIGLAVSSYHRVEMGVRLLSEEEKQKLAKFHRISATTLERQIRDTMVRHLEALEKGASPATLMPKGHRLVTQQRGRAADRLGIVHRLQLQKAIKVVHSSPVPARTGEPGAEVTGRETVVPVYGEMRKGKFVVDREGDHATIPLPTALRPEGECFAVRNYSSRLGVFYRPQSTLYVDAGVPPGPGDVVIFVRKDKTADAAVVISKGLDTVLQLYGPEETIEFNDPNISAIWRVRGVLFP